MNGLEDEFSGAGINFLQLDANSEDGGTIQRGFGLRGHPSIALVDANGQVVQKFVGGQSAEILRSAINNLLGVTP